MAKDKNSEQPISNQDDNNLDAIDRDAIYPEQKPIYQEICDFVEHQLKMSPLSAKKRSRLGWGVSDAIKVLKSVHVREADRYHHFRSINKNIQKLLEDLRKLMNDSEGLALMQITQERVNLATVIKTKNALCGLSNCIDEVIANNWSVPPETPMGSPEKGDAFAMFVYHLLQTWKDIYGII